MPPKRKSRIRLRREVRDQICVFASENGVDEVYVGGRLGNSARIIYLYLSDYDKTKHRIEKALENLHVPHPLIPTPKSSREIGKPANVILYPRR